MGNSLTPANGSRGNIVYYSLSDGAGSDGEEETVDFGEGDGLSILMDREPLLDGTPNGEGLSTASSPSYGAIERVAEGSSKMVYCKTDTVGRYLLSAFGFGVGIALLSYSIAGVEVGSTGFCLLAMTVGFIFQMAIRMLPDKAHPRSREKTTLGKAVDMVRDKLMRHSGAFFEAWTQAYLNLPNPLWFKTLTYGTFNIIGGQTIAEFLTNTVTFSYKHDIARDTCRHVQTLTTDDSSPTYVKMVWGTGEHAVRDRLLLEAGRILLSTGAVVIGVLPEGVLWILPTGSKVILTIGTLGCGIGISSLTVEALYQLKLRLRSQAAAERNDDTENMFEDVAVEPSAREKTIAYSERVLQLFGEIAPGALAGLGHAASNFFAGFGAGALGHMRLLRFTCTPIEDQPELKKRAFVEKSTTEKVAVVGKWVFALCLAGFLITGIVQGFTQGVLSDSIVLSVFALAVFGSYAAARYVDIREVPNEDPWINTFYWLTKCYGPPVAFIAINLVLNLGDEALEQYPELVVVAFCAAYASLGLAFGSKYGHNDTLRGNEYPMRRNDLFALLSDFMAEQLGRPVGGQVDSRSIKEMFTVARSWLSGRGSLLPLY